MTTKFRTIQSKFETAHKRRKRAMSTSQTGCILHRRAGVLPPDALIEKLLAENPSGWGAATFSEEDGKKFLQINSDIEGFTIGEFKKTCKDFNDQDIIFYFCSSEVALSLSDISPHILVETLVSEGPPVETEPQLVVFIEGNFPGSDKPESSHPPEYHLVEDALREKFEGLYEMVDGDLDKLMEGIKKPAIGKELKLQSVSRGVMTFMAANGGAFTIEQNDLGVKGDWGWCSNGYGYGKEEAAPVETKKPGIFKRGTKSTVREAAHTATVPTATAKPSIAPKASTAIAAASKTQGIDGYTVKRWKPQESYSRKETRNAYKMRIGYCPEGWEEKVEIDVYADKEGKAISLSQAKQALGLKFPAMAELLKNPPKAKDTETDHVDGRQAQTAVQTGSKATAEILPIISPPSREYVNDVRRKDGYKKIIDENAKVINDPKQFETYETKHASFIQQMGMKSYHEYGCWDDAMIFGLCKDRPDAAFVMIRSLLSLGMKHKLPEFIDKVEEKKETAPATTTKPSIFKRSSAA